MKSIVSRRKFIKVSGLAGTALLLPGLLGREAQAQALALESQVLGEGLNLFSGAGGNVLAKKAASGELLLVDGGLREHAEALLELIRRELGEGRVSRLINTHWHPEQTGLNEILGPQGSIIFAHENTRQWLGTKIQRVNDGQVFPPLPAAALPSETFHHFGDLDHGGTPLQYGYLRQAHTDGDMYVYFPQENVLHTGGALNSDSWPELDWWTGGWIGGLAQASATLAELANDATVVVPAQGPLIDKARLLEMRDMYATLNTRIRELFNGAKSPEEAVAARPAAEFEARMGNADRFVLQAFESCYAHFTPDA